MGGVTRRRRARPAYYHGVRCVDRVTGARRASTGYTAPGARPFAGTVAAFRAGRGARDSAWGGWGMPDRGADGTLSQGMGPARGRSTMSDGGGTIAHDSDSGASPPARGAHPSAAARLRRRLAFDRGSSFADRSFADYGFAVRAVAEGDPSAMAGPRSPAAMRGAGTAAG